MPVHSKPKICRVSEFDSQRINTFEFIWCLKNGVRSIAKNLCKLKRKVFIFNKRLNGVGLESGLMCKTFKGHVLTIISKIFCKPREKSIFLSQGIRNTIDFSNTTCEQVVYTTVTYDLKVFFWFPHSCHIGHIQKSNHQKYTTIQLWYVYLFHLFQIHLTHR